MANPRAAARAKRAAERAAALEELRLAQEENPLVSTLEGDDPFASTVDEIAIPVAVEDFLDIDDIQIDPSVLESRFGKYGSIAGGTNTSDKTASEKAAAWAAAKDQRDANQAIWSTYTDEEKQLSAQNNLLEQYGVSSADFGNVILDKDEFGSLLSRLSNEVVETQTANLNNLAKENPDVFAKEYGAISSKSKLSFLSNLYKEGTLNKEDYLNSAAQTLQAADKNSSNVYTIQEGKLYTAPKNQAKNPATFSEVVLFDNQVSGTYNTAYSTASNVLSSTIGETGEYGSLAPSGLTKLLNSAPINFAASMFGPIGIAALTGLKAANGQTLHATDWAKLAMAGASYYGTDVATGVADASTVGSEAGLSIGDVDAFGNTMSNAGDLAVADAFANGTLVANNFAVGSLSAGDIALYDQIYNSANAAVEAAAWSKDLTEMASAFGFDLSQVITNPDITTAFDLDVLTAVGELEEIAAGAGSGVVVNFTSDTTDEAASSTSTVDILNTITTAYENERLERVAADAKAAADAKTAADAKAASDAQAAADAQAKADAAAAEAKANSDREKQAALDLQADKDARAAKAAADAAAKTAADA